MKLLKPFLFLSFAIFFSFYLVNSSFLEKIKQNLSDFYQQRQLEKVYVHTDKMQYVAGDTIWLKAYLADAQNHQPIEKSKVLYVDLLDEKANKIQTRKLYVENGGAAADIALAANLPAGDYLLQAYTKYQLNYASVYIFQQNIPVYFQPISEKTASANTLINSETEQQIDPSYRPEIAFFPEGGKLVHNLTSQVAWRATDPESRTGIAVSGRIEDAQGNVISLIKTYEVGNGIFPLTPKTGGNYFAVLTIGNVEQSFPLPPAQAQGEVLNIDNKKESTALTVVSNRKDGLRNYSLVAHVRGNYVFGYTITEPKSALKLELPHDDLPAGLLHLTLFDPTGLPVGERLIYIENTPTDTPLIQTNLKKKTYQKREQVTLEVAFNSITKNDTGNFSLAVVDANSQVLQLQNDNIESWLLLNSDLKNKLEQPGYYFGNQRDAKRSKLLDIALMMHDWQQFDWQNLTIENKTFQPRFASEKGLQLTGETTYEIRDNKSVAADVFLTFLPTMLTEQFVTSADGNFTYGPFIANDTIDIILQARIASDKEREGMLDGKSNVRIKVNKQTPLPTIARWRTPILSLNSTKNDQINAYLQAVRRAKVADENYSMKVVDLDGAVITANRKDPNPVSRANAAAPFPTNRVIVDSLVREVYTFNSVFDILRRVSGVIVRGGFPTYEVTMRGVNSILLSSTPLYLLDGIPIDEESVNALAVQNVYHVDVYKDASTAFYGSRGSNGVIAIYTRTGTSDAVAQTEKAGILNLSIPGFYTAHDFYSPDYGSDVLINPKPDYRTTLHWEPELLLKGDSIAKISFYTGDKSGVFEVVTEGITTSGQVCREVQILRVE